MKRAAELLQGGAVMDRLLQPHESHTNYVLQFMMDYNLQGMNTVRRGVIKCTVGTQADTTNVKAHQSHV